MSLESQFAGKCSDPDAFLVAIKTVARARGMTQLAKDSGLGRENFSGQFQLGRERGAVIEHEARAGVVGAAFYQAAVNGGLIVARRT